jgi:YVTN family beta-propeller protein
MASEVTEQPRGESGTAGPSLAATIAVGRRPYALAVHPDTGRVYVASLDDATVSVIDPATNMVTATIPVGTRPEGMALRAR